MLDVAEKHLSQLLWRMAERRIRDRAAQMRNQHYWWDTPEKAAVWIACAEHMADGSYPEASTIRDQTYPRVLKQLTENRRVDSGKATK